MKNKFLQLGIVFTSLVVLGSCDSIKSTENSTEQEEEMVSNETSEPTLIGKWRLVNFEMDGNAKFDECDAKTVWDFTEDQVGNYQGKKLFRLSSTVEDPLCRLFGFSSEWEEVADDAKEVYIDNVKVGKGTNKGGMFKIDELTTKTLVLRGGTWIYYLER
jgi:hypothetical protein